MVSPTLFPDQAEVADNSLNFFYYWRKPDGWIVANPGHPNAFASRTKRGWIPLTQYGSYVPGHASHDARGIAFSAAREGWRVGFQTDAEGFAKEFKAEQIIAYGWHVSPPYREVTFPQLDGMDIPYYKCPECVHIPFNRATDLATHLKVGHDYSRVDIKAYGDDLGVDFTQKAAREETASLQQAAETRLKEQGYEVSTAVCDFPDCNWAPGAHVTNTAKSLATHRRMAHERTRVPEEEPAHEGGESNGETVLQRADAG